MQSFDLSLAALPHYALLSLLRGLAAYALSIAFTLVYGYWAAKDRFAGRLLSPLLDILQSIPILGFMPGLVITLAALFQGSRTGLEIAAVLMMFTSQAWNLTFSYIHSLESVPAELGEAATMYRFSWRRRLLEVELPFAMTGLVWNSMMSMAGGWFFLMVNESFQLGGKDYRLPGLGSYMSEAVARGNWPAMAGAVLAMIAVIVGLDQLLWKPMVAWSQKFRVEDSAGAERERSSLLDFLRESRLLSGLREGMLRLGAWLAGGREGANRWGGPLSKAGTLVLVLLLAWGGFRLALLLAACQGGLWLGLAADGGLTLLRVAAACLLGLAWTLPLGLFIGLNPRLSKMLQGPIQVAASFPAPMLFPALVLLLRAWGVSLDWGSVFILLLGTQWYILFNVIAGCNSIPSDLREAAEAFRFGAWQRFRIVYFPSIFPYLVTGLVTAAGGAWNASIVAEYVNTPGGVLTAPGLGSRISLAAEHGDFPSLAAAVTVMSLLVVLVNRTLWRRLFRLAETRYSLSR